ERDGNHRERHRVVAEDRLAAEDGQDLGGDAHGRQDQDVDLRMAEVPEEVLPEQRLAAATRPEPAGDERAVEQEHRDARGEDRQPAAAWPPSTQKPDSMMRPALSGTQNDRMLRKGNAMSRAPIISGMQKFPKAPARIGMITKKIMIVACIVNAML